MLPDRDSCLRAVASRDARFDGRFVVAVRTTGIYCRPSCPARPKPEHLRFFPHAAAAQSAGFRACKRCRPDATPGSPEWDVRADVVARAVRLVADGVVDREGVAGLARRLGYSERHLHRQLVAELGAGPQALARAQRAHTARVLLETTDLRAVEVAFAAGFASVRQFNDVVRAVFGRTPTELRTAGRRHAAPQQPGAVVLRLAYRAPFAAAPLLGFLGSRAVAGVEEWDGTTYARTLGLPYGTGVVRLSDADGHVRCELALDDLRDLGAAAQRCRRLLDLDADPVAVDADLGADPALGDAVRATPGRRVPGTVDGDETAIRAVLGQQVSVAAARTLAARLTTRLGKPLTRPTGTLTHLFPAADALAGAADEDLAMPAARRTAVRGVAAALAAGGVVLDPGADREAAAGALLRLPGVGPWTVGYVRMRALGDPDAFPAGDLGLRRGAVRLGLDGRAAALSARAERWRPWRAYAAQHLWAVDAGGRP